MLLGVFFLPIQLCAPGSSVLLFFRGSERETQSDTAYQFFKQHPQTGVSGLGVSACRKSLFCFEEGSQTADTAYPLFGLSRRCIPSWVSRAHSSLPSQRIYLFVDNLSTPRPETPVWGCISYMILRALSQFRLNRLAAHIPASPKPPLGSSGAGGSDGITIPPVGSSGRFASPKPPLGSSTDGL